VVIRRLLPHLHERRVGLGGIRGVELQALDQGPAARQQRNQGLVLLQKQNGFCSVLTSHRVKSFSCIAANPNERNDVSLVSKPEIDL